MYKFSLIVLFSLFISNIYGQDNQKDLFIEADTKVLNKEQKKLYDNIINHKTVVASSLYKLNLSAINNKQEKIDIKFKVNKFSVEILKCSIKKGKSRGVDRIFVDLESEGNNSVTIVINPTKSIASGLIYYGIAAPNNNSKIYSIEPVGDGYHVICLIDQTKFPKD